MEKEDNGKGFDEWWQEKKNRYKLMEIYHTTADFNIAIMEIAKIAWEASAGEGAKRRNKPPKQEKMLS